MSVEQTERTLREYLDVLVDRRDFSRFFAEDVVWTTMETGDEVRGRQAVADLIVALHTQMFDARPALKRTIAADGAALVEADFVGTHVGEFAGIAATGVSVRVPYCVVYDIDGSTITALRAYFPMAVLTRRLSEATPVPA